MNFFMKACSISHRLRPKERVREMQLCNPPRDVHSFTGVQHEVKLERGGKIAFMVTVKAVEIKAALDQVAASLSSPEGSHLLTHTVDAGKSVYQIAQNGVNNWSPLLEKLDIFSNIMGNVAEVGVPTSMHEYSIHRILYLQVHPYAKMAWSILDAVYQVSTV